MNTYEKPLKVLVCGTNFGRVYLKGLERCGDKFKIAGIFSHGSTQSKQEAGPTSGKASFIVRAFTTKSYSN